MKKAIKERLKPIIEKCIELVEREDQEALMGRLLILTDKIQNQDDTDAAAELAILVIATEEFSKQN